MEIAFSIPSPFCYLVTKTDRTSCDYWWLKNCISVGHFTLTMMLSTTQLHQIQIFFPAVLFTVALTTQGDKKFSDTGNREETIKEEAFVVCEVRAWSSLVHIMAMSSVLCRPIVSMYPSVQFKYRCLVNGIINPRTSDTSATPKEPLNILWSRDGNLDNADGGWYIPNHFVPVVLADEPDSDKQHCPSISKNSTPKRKQQGTLFSFLKPKATTVPAEKPKGLKRKTCNAGLDNKADVKKSPSASAASKKKII